MKTCDQRRMPNFALALFACLSLTAAQVGAQSSDNVRGQFAHVEEETRGGPFTADWESLGTYRVPECPRYGWPGEACGKQDHATK
jgi:hypothetical protein